MTDAGCGWGAVVASERMAALAAQLAASADPTAAAAEFWETVQGAPLWAADEERAGAWRATFLWRGDPALTKQVMLCGPVALGATSAEGGLRFDHIAGTDVWHLTVQVPAQTRSTYAISPNGPTGPAADLDEFLRRQATWVRDPLNPSTFVVPVNDDHPEWTPRIFSVLEAPDAIPQRWRIVQPGIARGALEEQTFASAVLGSTRKVWTYTPAHWEAGADESPLLFAFDGWEAVNLTRLPVVLDNLIAKGLIPPVVAVLVGNGTIEMRSRELDCDESFLACLTDELMPWASERWGLTPDRARTLLVGESLGGRAAVFAGLRRPDLFGKVIAQSAAVTEGGGLALDRLTDAERARTAEPLELYLDVGLLETDRSGQMAFLGGVRRLREVLRGAGHVVHGGDLACGHDDIVLGESVADGLRILLGSARPSAAAARMAARSPE